MNHASNRQNAGAAFFRVVGLSMTVALSTALSAHAQAPQPSADDSVIRRGAPDVAMPSSRRGEDGRPVRTEPMTQTRFASSVLRGAIGQVPESVGQCEIVEGRTRTTVAYESGLPVLMTKHEGDVREERTALRWDADRVLLLREQWSLRVKQNTTRGGGSWQAQQWRTESTTWDSYGRPLERVTTAASGQSTSYRCEWLGFRAGTCATNNLQTAAVRLTARGEVEGVEWRERGKDVIKGRLAATWGASLLTLERAKGQTIEHETYRYDGEGSLSQFRRTTTLPRGERVATWSLRRDARGNVTSVRRQCEGPCEGMRGETVYTIRYDETLRNTFCGAWWDDGIEPTLRGW